MVAQVKLLAVPSHVAAYVTAVAVGLAFAKVQPHPTSMEMKLPPALGVVSLKAALFEDAADSVQLTVATLVEPAAQTAGSIAAPEMAAPAGAAPNVRPPRATAAAATAAETRRSMGPPSQSVLGN
jgi:hypothetical protein